jgi:hypothetical protein
MSADLERKSLKNRLLRQPKSRVVVCLARYQGNSPWILPASKGTTIASTSTTALVDQKANHMLKGTLETNKQVAWDPK